jgi:hypothetical protein
LYIVSISVNYIFNLLYITSTTGFWRENLREKFHWVDQGIDGKIIVRQFFRKWGYRLDRAGPG